MNDGLLRMYSEWWKEWRSMAGGGDMGFACDRGLLRRSFLGQRFLFLLAYYVNMTISYPNPLPPPFFPLLGPSSLCPSLPHSSITTAALHPDIRLRIFATPVVHYSPSIFPQGDQETLLIPFGLFS